MSFWPRSQSTHHCWRFGCEVASDSCDPGTAACQAPLSMGFPRQEHWSGLLFPFPEDLPNPGIEPGSPAFAYGFFTAESPEILPTYHYICLKMSFKILKIRHAWGRKRLTIYRCPEFLKSLTSTNLFSRTFHVILGLWHILPDFFQCGYIPPPWGLYFTQFCVTFFTSYYIIESYICFIFFPIERYLAIFHYFV